MAKEAEPYFVPEGPSEIPEGRNSSDGPSHYVGIGASAGGLEAIEAFFKNMPEDSGMCFIVVQHLSPDYKSLMVELLSKRTKMRVNPCRGGGRGVPERGVPDPAQEEPSDFPRQVALGQPRLFPGDQSSHRRIFKVFGRGPGGEGGGDHSVGDRERRDEGHSKRQGVRGHGDGAGRGIGQVRRHAQERHIDRARGFHTSARRHARAASGLRQAPVRDQDRAFGHHPHRRGPSGPHIFPAAGQDQARFHLLQAQHGGAKNRAAHDGQPGARPSGLCPFSGDQPERNPHAVPGASDRGHQFFPGPSGFPETRRHPSSPTLRKTSRQGASVLGHRVFHRRGGVHRRHSFP